MPLDEKDALDLILNYHQRTKHHPNRYARSLGYLDWPNQPDPFRTFAGTKKIDLLHPELRQAPSYDALFAETTSPTPLDPGFVARLFTHSLALSAWKQAPGTQPWSLRINPSSGALHPTEGYLVTGAIPGLIDPPGVFHYAPFHHQLERRGSFSTQEWQALTAGYPQPCLLLGLTSIYWRESWKYGERAFRYCHHDVGHAIGALAFAARTLGWDLHLLGEMPGEALARLLGTHLQPGIEAEHPDCLLLLSPAAEPAPPIPTLSPAQWESRLPQAAFHGEPNHLSRNHHPWPAIEQVAEAAAQRPAALSAKMAFSPPLEQAPADLLPDRELPAEQVIRQRRSAVRMDEASTLDRQAFYQLLTRLHPACFPFRTLPWLSRISLAFFVHRVDNLAPGLYLLARDSSHQHSLAEGLQPSFTWQKPAGCPPELLLYHLLAGDTRQPARNLSCHQDIASDGVFAAAMLARFDSTLQERGAGFYPRLFWEAGLIGQVLYLEAEAAGLRGTGIGCFFDDLVHEFLGIGDLDWQSIYHFTVGGPLEDSRLRTIPPYDHLSDRQT